MSQSSDIAASLNREAQDFDAQMISICNHIEDIIRCYGGHYALVYWLSDNDQLKSCVTVNLGWRDAFSREIFAAFKKKSSFLLQKDTWTLFPKCVKVIWGSGTGTPREVAQGWWNKKRSIHGKLQNFENFGYCLPAIIVVRGGERSLNLCYPVGDADLMALVHRIDEHYGVSLEQQGKGLPPNPPRLDPGANKKHRIDSYRLDCGNLAKKRSLSSSKKEIEEHLGVKDIHDPRTLAWYCNELKRSDSVPVTPLYESDCYYQWACADARVFADKKATHHVNMFVKVDLSKDQDSTPTCSCELFRQCTSNRWCVHTEYVRIYAPKLKKAEFSEPGEVIQLCKNNGDIVGYYVNGCFVRPRGKKGYRCDTDMMYSCKHVYAVCGEVGLDLGLETVKEMAEADSCEDEVEVEEIPTNAWAMQHLHQDSKIVYPYTSEMSKIVIKNARHGFGIDTDAMERQEQACMWFGNVLKPAVPDGKCLCMLDYRDEDMKLEDYCCTVYMKEPHCARRVPCMRLECPNGKRECTIHYSGLQHGFWRIDMTKIVEISLLVDSALKLIHFSGASFEAQWDELSERYDLYRLHGGNSTEGFMDLETFRAAVYNVAKCIDIDLSRLQSECEGLSGSEMAGMNMMLCPICKDTPDVIMMDGTAMTFSDRSFNAPSITSLCEEEEKVRPHAILDRCFLNVVKDNSTGRSRSRRNMLINLLQGFEAWVSRCKISKSKYLNIVELLEASKFWRLDGFIKWAYQECRGTACSNQKRMALQRMLCEIVSPSPTASYFPYSSAKALEGYLRVRKVPVDVIQQLGPCIKGLLTFCCNQLGDHAILPASWTPFLKELVKRTLDTYESPCFEQEHGLGSDILHQEDPSILNDGYIETGFCCGLPRLRHRPKYACDNIADDSEYIKKDKGICNHVFRKTGLRKGGVFTCLCKHGIAYACFVMKEAEGRNEPFTFLTCFLKEAPKIVLYNSACSLMDYCMNRAPAYFKDTLFLVHKFHWANHVTCARSFNIQAHSEDKFVMDNTEGSKICKKINSAIEELRLVLPGMPHEPFMIFLRLFFAWWNKQRLGKMRKSHERNG